MSFKINNTLLVLDTETGGVDPNKYSLMEIACIVIKNEKVVYKYTSLVKSPTGEYSCNEFARSLHNIKDEYIEKYGKLPEVIINDLKNIRDVYFNGNPMTIVAHNAAFDISFVKKMFADNGHGSSSNLTNDSLSYDNIFSRNAIDTATMALLLKLSGKIDFDRCSLDNILKYYNLHSKNQERHTALYDATQTAKAFLLMFKHINNMEINNDKKTDIKYDCDFNDFLK